MLLADWFARLAHDSGIDLKGYGKSGDTFTLGASNEFHITAHFIGAPPFLRFVASDIAKQEVVDSISREAAGHVERGDFGGTVWYSTILHETELKISPLFMGSFFERLGSQTRVLGWRRLGSNILLELTEDLPADWDQKKALFAPKAIVHVHISTPAPCAGHFSSHVAHNILETVAAICTFALGRCTALPPSLFPSKSDMLTQLAKRQVDRDILTLARKHVSLDIFSPFAIPDGLELFTRMRAALLTFDAAVRQESNLVACILYVVTAETLATPYTEWRHSKMTKRFIEFFDELIPTDLDKIVAHDNFEEAFSIRRGTRTARALRRELLDRLYDYRSGLLHQGLYPSYRGIGGFLDMKDEVRRGLFYDFAEAAILNFIAAPRVSLIGHPKFE